MKEQRSYKYAFVLALIACLVLTGALGYVIIKSHSRVAAMATNSQSADIVVAKGPEATTPVGSPTRDSTSPAPTLAPVQLSPQRLQAIGVTTATAEVQDVSNDLQVPGNVDVDERNLAYVQTRFPGWIQKVFVNATYQYVRRGQPLFTIYSPELVSTEQEYMLAKENQQALAGDIHGRAEKESGWLLQAAADRLTQFGVPSSEIARLEKTGTVQHDITVESPASGYITEYNALPNAYVQTATKLYTVADLFNVWVYANVYQTDVGQLKPATPATVTVDAYPGRSFRGRIDQILPQVDPATRTVRVRFVFSNPGLALKPGMFVSVNINVPLGRQLVIPASAVLQTGTREIAFLDHGGGYLEPREIETGPRLDDHVIVLKGLRAGDRVISSANFLVDSEAQLQAAVGSFAPPPPGAGAAASMNQPAVQAAVDFTTQPSPPQKGSNILQVKLTSAEGKAITQAKVTVTFYMLAMPAMGMAATKKLATLAEKGDGVYGGSVDLPSGGSYQVTVTAARDGKTIATKQLIVSATGGM